MTTHGDTLQHNDMSTANRAAERMVQQHLVDAERHVVFPVELTRVSAGEGIIVYEAPMEHYIAGLIVQSAVDAPVEIFLNTQDDRVQQRVTWSHLLGHALYAKQEQYVLGRIAYRERLAISCPDPVEQWCQAFGGALLMPAFAVRKLWSQGYSVSKMAKHFHVTNATLYRRVASMGLS